MSKEVITEESKKIKNHKREREKWIQNFHKKVDKNPAFLCIYSNLHGAGRKKQNLTRENEWL